MHQATLIYLHSYVLNIILIILTKIFVIISLICPKDNLWIAGLPFRTLTGTGFSLNENGSQVNIDWVSAT